MLRLIGLNQRLGSFTPSASVNRLLNAPARLRTKVGERKLPNSRLLANTRNRLTQAAVAKSKRYSTYSVTILAMPGFTPGKGEGMMASAMCRPIASAASLAMRWSSAVVLMMMFFCISASLSAFGDCLAYAAFAGAQILCDSSIGQDLASYEPML